MQENYLFCFDLIQGTHPNYGVELSHGDLLGALHRGGHLLLVLQHTITMSSSPYLLHQHQAIRNV
jgi:hypothetical protein